ncbi:hypothetical protein RFI_33832 [Reticulomyxa filosa]|uniref:Uncharacterized protein n=1 Tax=Reticulomyxa filosa TaxID=46433 RepID=X6LS39_RETFI|nr:hypothetical protein RFI_33832 [Reticulomyxa filosa]|eukprot:ETO03570.1 hypothetical protein RFI_33832 [Reticulomyxa filosa]
MLGLDKVMEKPDDIEIKLKTKEIVNIKAISDTRASIFATSDWIANKFSQLLTKNSLAFNGAHAGSLQEKLEQDPNNKNMIMFKEKFYVVPNLPHKFILSRSALRKLDEILDEQDLESSSESKNNDDQRNFNITCNDAK